MVMAAAGEGHSIFCLKRDTCGPGAWGLNSRGQLGMLLEEGMTTLGDNFNGPFWCWNVPTKLAAELFNSWDLVFVAAGCLHTAAVTRLGTLWLWGCGLNIFCFFFRPPWLGKCRRRACACSPGSKAFGRFAGGDDSVRTCTHLGCD